METLNVPYQKVIRNGIVINPIKNYYGSKRFLYYDDKKNPVFAPNRKERRAAKYIKIGNNRKQIKRRANGKLITRFKRLLGIQTN